MQHLKKNANLMLNVLKLLLLLKLEILNMVQIQLLIIDANHVAKLLNHAINLKLNVNFGFVLILIIGNFRIMERVIMYLLMVVFLKLFIQTNHNLSNLEAMIKDGIHLQ